MSTARTTRGFSIIELMIAMAIGALTMSAVVVFVGSDSSVATDGVIHAEALRKANDIIEKAAQDARVSYTTLAPWTNPSDCSGPLCYQTALSMPVAYQTQCSQAIVGTVTWTGEFNRGLSVRATTTVVNIPEMIALGGSCSYTPPASAWDNPGTFGDSDINPSGIKGMGLDVETIGGVRYVFLAAQHSSAGSNDLWIIDASDYTNPTVVASLNTGKGLNDVEVVKVGNSYYAYLAHNDNTNQLQTVNVTDPLNPVQVNQIAFGAYGVTTTGSDPQARTIAYYNGKLYVGLFNTVGPELLVFEVASTPAAPAYVGSIAANFNHSIYDIVVRGNYAYLATGNNNRELMIINISAATPVDTGLGFNANNHAQDDEEATALFLVGSRLYMGRERTNNASERDFYILDITNPIAPAVLGSKRLGLSPNTKVSGIAVAGPYAFLSTSNSNAGFEIWRIDNPANIHQPFACMTYNYSEKSTALRYIDDLIFVSNESNKALRVIKDEPSVCS